MKTFLFLCIAAIGISSCHNTAAPGNAVSAIDTAKAEPAVSPDPAALSSNVFSIYESLPSGASTSMTLELAMHSGTYKLIQKDQAQNRTSTGSYNTERGFEADENATLYVLNDSLPASGQLFFLRETGKDSLLVQLDQRHRSKGKVQVLKLAAKK